MEAKPLHSALNPHRKTSIISSRNQGTGGVNLGDAIDGGFDQALNRVGHMLNSAHGGGSVSGGRVVGGAPVPARRLPPEVAMP